MKKWLTLALVLCLLASGACGMETQEEPAVLDWGVTLSAKDVTATGCTLVCTRSGGEIQDELITGEPFWLERWENGQWNDLPGEEGLAWVMPAYPLREEEPLELKCSWSSFYGALEPGLYRLGKNISSSLPGIDGETRQHYALFAIEEPQEGRADWGIEMSAVSVTSTGCTVVIRQRGGSPTGELEFGAPFWIEILTSSGWMEFPTTTIVDWIDIAYTIPKEGETQWDCTWERLYGTLPQGTYRLGKEILDWRAPGNYDRQTCYTMFTIQ